MQDKEDQPAKKRKNSRDTIALLEAQARVIFAHHRVV
jgi:hypothetical protein